jgi:hypothetical protein
VAFTCPICGRTSHLPRDKAERFCVCCGFLEDVNPLTERARARYRDASFPERACDACGKPYRGPAVYCSLDCAIADA